MYFNRYVRMIKIERIRKIHCAVNRKFLFVQTYTCLCYDMYMERRYPVTDIIISARKSHRPAHQRASIGLKFIASPTAAAPRAAAGLVMKYIE